MQNKDPKKKKKKKIHGNAGRGRRVGDNRRQALLTTEGKCWEAASVCI